MNSIPITSRRHLVVLRAGDNSLHAQWIAGKRHFDLFISYYGAEPDRHRADADGYEMRKGPKWSCLAEVIDAHPEWLNQYDHFWFPDDDLAADTTTLNRMFALFEGMNLALAQPALTPSSYYTWPLLLQEQGSVLRYTRFVEVMAPLMTADTLRQCLPAMGTSRSGWGLDWVWGALVGQEGPRRIAILDATPVTHTRPVGGELYKNNPEMDPRREQDRLVASHGLERFRDEAPYQIDARLAFEAPKLLERLRAGLKAWNAARRRARRSARA